MQLTEILPHFCVMKCCVNVYGKKVEMSISNYTELYLKVKKKSESQHT